MTASATLLRRPDASSSASQSFLLNASWMKSFSIRYV
jgi:hypothetical protein